MASHHIPITAGQIDALVHAFYSRIRENEELGPIFQRSIGTSAEEWGQHEIRIASFWRNATGLDRSFRGNPMLKHLANTEIEPEHFPKWLALFRETALETLPEDAALGMADLADRIGRSLKMGMIQFRNPDRVPVIRHAE